MTLTPGKLRGMKAVADTRGVIAAAAMDQRGSLRKSLAKARGGDISDAMMEEFKGLVTEVLTAHASAILDPEAFRRPGVATPAAGCSWRTEKTWPREDGLGVSPTCSTTVSPAAWAKPARTASRSSTTRPSIRSRSTTRNTPGSSASAMSAAPTTFPSFSSSWDTRRASTSGVWSMRRRSRTSSQRAWRSSARIGTASMC